MESGEAVILIVEARFYEDIADDLARGAITELEKQGVAYERVQVPGTFEIPAAVHYAIVGSKAGRYSGFITLGCVIRGETDHYDHICREAIGALMDLSMTHTIAHGMGILTVENHSQAAVRADPRRKDAGGQAARACLAMIDLKKQLALDS